MNILTTVLMGTNKFLEPVLQDIASSVPDHCNKVGVSMKGVVIFLLVKGLALNLWKMQHLGSTIKQSMPTFLSLK